MGIIDPVTLLLLLIHNKLSSKLVNIFLFQSYKILQHRDKILIQQPLKVTGSITIYMVSKLILKKAFFKMAKK